MVELGAGTGVPSLACIVAGAQSVVVTDRDRGLLDNIKFNLALNAEALSETMLHPRSPCSPPPPPRAPDALPVAPCAARTELLRWEEVLEHVRRNAEEGKERRDAEQQASAWEEEAKWRASAELIVGSELMHVEADMAALAATVGLLLTPPFRQRACGAGEGAGGDDDGDEDGARGGGGEGGEFWGVSPGVSRRGAILRFCACCER